MREVLSRRLTVGNGVILAIIVLAATAFGVGVFTQQASDARARIERESEARSMALRVEAAARARDVNKASRERARISRMLLRRQCEDIEGLKRSMRRILIVAGAKAGSPLLAEIEPARNCRRSISLPRGAP